MKKRMETLIEEMLDGQLLLAEAMAEFEKIFIQAALERNNNHISNTAETLGVHRNTVAKKLASYNGTRNNGSAGGSGKKKASSNTRK